MRFCLPENTKAERAHILLISMHLRTQSRVFFCKYTLTALTSADERMRCMAGRVPASQRERAHPQRHTHICVLFCTASCAKFYLWSRVEFHSRGGATAWTRVAAALRRAREREM